MTHLSTGRGNVFDISHERGTIVVYGPKLSEEIVRHICADFDALLPGVDYTLVVPPITSNPDGRITIDGH